MKKLEWLENTQIENKVFMITGATSGIGFDVALALAKKKAKVIVAARNENKAQKCIENIIEISNNSNVSFIKLDVSKLGSVNECINELKIKNIKLDTLIINAGIFNIPTYNESIDGFELQLATNYFGHFYLTNNIIPFLKDKARIVITSSLAAAFSKIYYDDLNLKNSYKPFRAYGQSKLALLMYANSLKDKLSIIRDDIKIVSCHPGVAQTSLSRAENKRGKFYQNFINFGFTVVGQPSKKGALTTLYAAINQNIQNGDYIGPSGLLGFKGYPKKVKMPKKALDKEKNDRLFNITNELLNCRKTSI